ncbi:MAG TPA: hypothetical protein DIC34_10215 [Treponema sp.]|nr:MAG: hypothetical protein A2Y36_07285 [Treponema sp. GWA1_62_8]OHE69938.1 MAG: hypothetical protein A2001_10825 [Treponema sp. GWC1_61_84]OHE70565.1 MAG: hypothetical protein A2413_10705 [Treponema sp. RIFOXYC1_FULL_61_9]HCM26901.1 hypothetical protein [Treponema sp.]
MKKITVSILALALILGCAEKKEPVAAEAADPGYSLQFADGFDSGMNFVDDFGISIVLVVDVSGSMADSPKSGGSAKYIQAANALVTVSEYLEKLAGEQKDLRVNVAVLRFSTGVATVLPMTELRGDGIERLKSICSPENFLPKGGTAIGLALEKGSELLAQSGTIFNSLIIITDGENNGTPDPMKVIDAIYSNRNNKSTEAMKISTSTQLMSFIGFDIDSPQFGVFHELGARITSASDQAELENGLKSLLEADITKLE